jgi:DNA polymerase III subunit epsilon
MANFSTAKAITFFDTEVTHLEEQHSALLEICIITDWEDGSQSAYHTKVRPTLKELSLASKEALEVNGFNREEWEEAPSFDEVAGRIAKALTWGPIVAHNIQFDLKHLTAIFERYGWQRANRTNISKKEFSFGYPAIDTCALAFMYSPSDRQNMTALREHYNLSHEGAHSAMKDCEDCRTIFYEIISNTIG